MLRPVQLLALLDWSDLEYNSGRRGRVHPSLPEAGHPPLESGITTQPSWGRTVTGLSPTGVLPLQAARSVANLIVTDCYLYYVVVLSPIHSNIWHGLESLRQNLSLFLLSFYQQVFLTEWLKAQ